MHAVTAVMNAYQPSRPCSLDGSRMTSAARSPAWWIVQPIMATATIGSVMALTRKMGRSLRGWMRVKGNWKSQKRKKQSMLELSTPADSGSVFLRLANDGQMAVRQILTPVPPWYVLQREGRQSCPRFGRRGGGRATREDEGGADALDREPEPSDDHARDDGEAREVVAVGGARTDREGNVKASADDTLQRVRARVSTAFLRPCCCYQPHRAREHAAGAQEDVEVGGEGEERGEGTARTRARDGGRTLKTMTTQRRTPPVKVAKRPCHL